MIRRDLRAGAPVALQRRVLAIGALLASVIGTRPPRSDPPGAARRRAPQPPARRRVLHLHRANAVACSRRRSPLYLGFLRSVPFADAAAVAPWAVVSGASHPAWRSAFAAREVPGKRPSAARSVPSRCG
jgi:hypothetical protein